MATIDEVFAEFLDEQRIRLSDRTYQQYEQVIELLAMSMNGYAPNGLTDEEFERWERRYETDETSAFTGLFGPDKIPENVGEFLNYFMIRKVMASKELLKSAGTVTEKLAQWLARNGHLDTTNAAVMADRGGEASTELSALDKLADLLYDEAERLRQPAQIEPPRPRPRCHSNRRLGFSGRCGQPPVPAEPPGLEGLRGAAY